MAWDKDKIESILPHREPFLFIDEVTEIEEGRRIVAKKYIRPEEYFFKGHFPGRPIMPGVLIIEAMAQATLLLYCTARPEIAAAGPDYYLGKSCAEFLHPAYPGDTLILEARNVKILDYAGIADVKASAGSRIAAKATISFAVKRRDGK